jgi:hypothetical protein
VDQVGSGQGRKRHVRVEIQLGRQEGDDGRVGWAGAGEETAEQAPVERPQRPRQSGLALLDATGRQPESGEPDPQLIECSGMRGRIGGHAAAPWPAVRVTANRRARR